MRAVAILVVLVLLAVGLVSYAAATDPERAANSCSGGDIAYWKPTGTYAVSAWGGDNAGTMNQVNIEQVDKPGSFGFALTVVMPQLFGVAESHGTAFVEISVSGPGGVAVGPWESTRTNFDFTSGDLLSGQSKQGLWKGPVVCFEKRGDAAWIFKLIWEDKNGRQVLDEVDRTSSV